MADLQKIIEIIAGARFLTGISSKANRCYRSRKPVEDNRPSCCIRRREFRQEKKHKLLSHVVDPVADSVVWNAWKVDDAGVEAVVLRNGLDVYETLGKTLILGSQEK